MRVLIADDDPTMTILLSRLVEQLGHQPVVANDGEAAWALQQRDHCPVVISDWSMPGCDGIELLQRIRTNDGEASYTYFILITSNESSAISEQAMAAGVDDLLHKPIRRSELSARLMVASRIIAMQRTLAERNEQLVEANRRMRRDMAAAASAQQSLLPEHLPSGHGYALGWRYQPCEACAGDMLGVVELPGDRLGLYIFDVSGHGVAAALLAVQVARALPPLMHQYADPLLVAEDLNRQFHRPGVTRFVTLSCGVLDRSSGVLDLVTCAHPTPFQLSLDGHLQHHEASSHPLGIIEPERVRFARQRHVLAPGDRLLCFSDGAVEALGHPAHDPQATPEYFGDDRLGAVWSHALALPLEGALTAVMDALAVWRGQGSLSDDIALLGIERLGD